MRLAKCSRPALAAVTYDLLAIWRALRVRMGAGLGSRLPLCPLCACWLGVRLHRLLAAWLRSMSVQSPPFFPCGLQYGEDPAELGAPAEASRALNFSFERYAPHLPALRAAHTDTALKELGA